MKLLEIFIATGDTFIIAGDVNVHLETEELYAKKLKEIIHVFNLQQHVIGPTHRLGHTLDAVITNTDKSFVSDLQITEFDLSDHFLVDFNLNLEVEYKEYNTITYRKVKAVNNESFCNEINYRKAIISNATNLQDKVNMYNQVLKEIVDTHAPKKTKTIKVVRKAPWFDIEYATLRKRRRHAEKKFRRTGLESDKSEFKRLRKETTELAYKKKKIHF